MGHLIDIRNSMLYTTTMGDMGLQWGEPDGPFVQKFKKEGEQ